MITFEEFADAYAAAVPKILAKMKYLERIGRDPFDENRPLPKWWHKVNNLKERRKQNRSNKIPFLIMIIKEQFVSFDTARMLKEAGFEAECGFTVDDDGRKLYRPTQALAARWLREVYNVAIYSLYDDDMEQWFYVVDAFTKNPVINGFQSGSEYDDYESAFEDGLREAIKLIKKQ